MAGKHKHIEDIFRNGLEGHTATPPKSGWTGMQESLDNISVEHLTQSQLGNASIQPSAGLWTKISSKIFWYQFLRFNPLQFNIYYAGVALIGGGAAIMGLSLSDPATSPVDLSGYPEALIDLESMEEAPVQDAAGISSDAETADFMALRSDEIVENKKTMEGKSKSPGRNALISDSSEKENKNDRKTREEFPDNRKGSTEKPANKYPVKHMPAGLSYYLPFNITVHTAEFGNPARRGDTIAIDHMGDPIVDDFNFVEQGYYAGALILKQDFVFLNDEIKETYKQNKNVSDFSYRFGIRFNIVRKNFMMQSGLYFSSMNNIFEHNQEIALIEDNIEGRVIWPYQSDTVFQKTTHKYHNSYTFIELPVLAGLHFEGKRFATNVKTGPLLNYLTGVNADLVLNSDNQLRSVDKSYFRRPGVRWELSADVIYKLGDHLSFYIEPAYVYDVTTLFKRDLELRSRFHGFSVGTGIYYRF